MKRKLTAAMLVSVLISGMIGTSPISTSAGEWASDSLVEDFMSSDSFAEEYSDEYLEEEAAREQEEKEAAELLEKINSEGSVFNIECWDEELKSRMIEHYPNYEEIDGTTGKIGNVEVHWNITPEADNAYQNYLDSRILTNQDTDPKDRIDLFLVGHDFAVKYANSDVTLPLDSLGITESELSDQFDYTKEIMTAEDNTLRGVTWSVWPGVLIYRRQAAIDTWGTDDPSEIEKHFSTWEDFSTAASELVEKGYSITPSVFDTYDAYASEASAPWISKDNTVSIRSELKTWAENSMDEIVKLQSAAVEPWTEEWMSGMYEKSTVFSYPGAAWLVSYGMNAEIEGTVAAKEGWAVCRAPQSWITRGSWICAAIGTDNETLCADIMRKMTMDPDILRSMAVRDNDIVNNKTVMESLRDDDRFTVNTLGGQNPIGTYVDAASSISAKNKTPYDLYCDEAFEEAMRSYFEGACTYEEAESSFYQTIVDKYEELSAP